MKKNWIQSCYDCNTTCLVVDFSLVGIVEHSFVDVHVGFSDTPMMSSVVVIMSTL